MLFFYGFPFMETGESSMYTRMDLVSSIGGQRNCCCSISYRDLLAELNTEEDVKNAKLDFTALKNIGEKVIITALGKKHDFVSVFAPIAGIDEDPVTGSAHSQLIPFWSEKLNKNIAGQTIIATRR